MISRGQNLKYVVRGHVEVIVIGMLEVMMECMLPVKLQKRSRLNIVGLDAEVTIA
ncbi:MAG: hypothetical protein ACJAUT_000141 [Cellvibrionaceae bacterium]|jgi:hypothetical protein